MQTVLPFSFFGLWKTQTVCIFCLCWMPSELKWACILDEPKPSHENTLETPTIQFLHWNSVETNICPAVSWWDPPLPCPIRGIMPCFNGVQRERFQRWRAAHPWHLHLWDFSDSPPWLVLQQRSFGTERSPCRVPSDSLRNSFRKHVLPNSSRHALISWKGREAGTERADSSLSLDVFGTTGRRWCHAAKRTCDSGTVLSLWSKWQQELSCPQRHSEDYKVHQGYTWDIPLISLRTSSPLNEEPITNTCSADGSLITHKPLLELHSKTAFF